MATGGEDDWRTILATDCAAYVWAIPMIAVAHHDVCVRIYECEIQRLILRILKFSGFGHFTIGSGLAARLGLSKYTKCADLLRRTVVIVAVSAPPAICSGNNYRPHLNINVNISHFININVINTEVTSKYALCHMSRAVHAPINRTSPTLNFNICKANHRSHTRIRQRRAEQSRAHQTNKNS